MAERDSYKDFGEYGIIGNTKMDALDGIDGSIDWCCFPTFHSSAVLTEILDHEVGDSFAVTLADGSSVR